MDLATRSALFIMERYARQILFSGIGARGQKNLLAAKVVIIGCGGLGTIHAETLTRAGVGQLVIVDRDLVEENNLQRQTLFDEADANEGVPKAIAAERRLKKINSTVGIKSVVDDVNYHNIETLTEDASMILDGTDNFETRFLINDVSCKREIPWVYGGCVGSYGLSMTVVPGQTPCLRCLFQESHLAGELPTCETAGVISPIINVIASIQVCEALKILTGNESKLLHRLVKVDLWEGELRLMDVMASRDEACTVCVQRKYEYLDGKRGAAAAVLCGRNAVQITSPFAMNIKLPALAERIKRLTQVTLNEFLLRFKIENYEVTVFPNGRGIVRGTDEPAVAKNVFAKYVGL